MHETQRFYDRKVQCDDENGLIREFKNIVWLILLEKQTWNYKHILESGKNFKYVPEV